MWTPYPPTSIMSEDDASITYYSIPRGIKGNFDAPFTLDVTSRRHKHKTDLEPYCTVDYPLTCCRAASKQSYLALSQIERYNRWSGDEAFGDRYS